MRIVSSMIRVYGFGAHRTLCQELLQHSEGMEHDDLLRDLVGFLEACKPRMMDLIEVRPWC